MEFIKQIFTKDFLLTQSPSADIRTHVPILIVAGAVFVWAVAASLILPAKNPALRKVKGKTTAFLIAVSLVAAAVTFFRWQQLGFFARNITLIVLSFFGLIWLATIIIYIIRKYPKEVYNFRDQQRIRKYLPRPKAK